MDAAYLVTFYVIISSPMRVPLAECREWNPNGIPMAMIEKWIFLIMFPRVAYAFCRYASFLFLLWREADIPVFFFLSFLSHLQHRRRLRKGAPDTDHVID